jgi:two-component system LytT family sensor kinase
MKKIQQIEFWAATLLLTVYVVIYVHHGNQLAERSAADHQYFDVVRYLLPNLLAGFTTYVAFVVINCVIVPKYWFTRRYTLALVWTIVSFMATVLSLAAIEHFQPGQTHQHIAGGHAIDFRLINQQFGSIAICFMLLAGYITVREVLLHQYRRYRLSQTLASRIIKEITIVAFVWFLVLNLLWGLNYRPLFQLFGVYYLIVIPFGVAVYFVNLYGLIPAYKNSKKRNLWPYILRLTAVVVSLILLETVFIKAGSYDLPANTLILTAWVIPIGLALPLSWMVYLANEKNYNKLTTLKAALNASDASLQLLRSQINPHFLFNTLNALYGTAIIDGSRRTAEGIQQLGDMMRFMLHDNQRDLIPLSSEINYLRNYLSLQQLRLGNAAVKIESEIDETNTSGLSIAPMLLIPLLENAFKHGIGPEDAGSEISVRLHIEGKRINFFVSNTIQPHNGYNTEKTHSGIGLSNVSQRLLVHYKGKHQFEYGTKGNTFTAWLVIDATEHFMLNTPNL